MARYRLATAALAVALLAVYAVTWINVSHAQIGTSDFTATYVGGTLLREGHRAGMYDAPLEAQLTAALLAPAHAGGNLNFLYPPPAAVLVAPLTLLPLGAAYRVYAAAQLAMLALALFIAARAAPWPRPLRQGRIPAVAALAALAGPGTLALGLLGQWDGVGALGLAGAYALWRRDARFAGGAALAASAALAKPHLALGLAALLVGWGERRVLAGAAAGVLGMIVVSLVAAGPAGLVGFVTSTLGDASRWPLSMMLGFTGLFGSWLGNGAVPQVLALAGSIVAIGLCVSLGRRLAHDGSLLEPCLATAAVLSLLASPHTLSHDIVLLAPMLVAMLAWAGARDGAAPWPGAAGRAVLGGWAVLSVAGAIDLGAQAAAPPGRLVPWVLLALAALLTRDLRIHGPGAPAQAPLSDRRRQNPVGARPPARQRGGFQ